jgi:methylenetetrahydrofolate dehydrogenase (NADP+)/methenyltetrahydrofolate cyclohydrolase
MVRPETVIVDVGSTFLGGRALGDADYANLEHYVTAISPVPGGVGPMTVAMVVENTWQAYEVQQRGKNQNSYNPAVSFRHQSEV